MDKKIKGFQMPKAMAEKIERTADEYGVRSSLWLRAVVQAQFDKPRVLKLTK
jgi:hypothetical protein